MNGVIFPTKDSRSHRACSMVISRTMCFNSSLSEPLDHILKMTYTKDQKEKGNQRKKAGIRDAHARCSSSNTNS